MSLYVHWSSTTTAGWLDICVTASEADDAIWSSHYLAHWSSTQNQEELRELLCLVFSFSACYSCWLGRAPVCPQRLALSQVPARLLLQLGATVLDPLALHLFFLFKKEPDCEQCNRAQLSSLTSPPRCCEDQQLAQLFQRLDERFRENRGLIGAASFLETHLFFWLRTLWLTRPLS